MGRAVVEACLPWFGLLMAGFACAWFVARLDRSRLRLARLQDLHRDQTGSAQSLSFVLTLPFFVMILLFIVQVSQLMIGTMVVHYAAFAGARSAIVWIPAAVQGDEGRNCISAYSPDPDVRDQVSPMLDPQNEAYGPADGGVTYVVTPGSHKYEKISSAAVLACMPISPSRNLGLTLDGSHSVAAQILLRAYQSTVAGASQDASVGRRIRNKMAYAAKNTTVEIRFFHKNQEPPLVTYFLEDDVTEFAFNEIGWQDPVTVTVQYNLALLPGPGRLLARTVLGPGGSPDEVSSSIRQEGKTYVYPLQASATLGNEGEKSVIPYVYPVY